MRKIIVLSFLFFIAVAAFAKTITVKNIDELNKANKEAQPGDIVILQNGTWNDVVIKLTCDGTKEAPIRFKAQTNGKVIISGQSSLRVGGNYIIVEGLYFTNGYAGKDPVFSFRAGKDQLANNSRITNCTIENFNNPKRMDENNWVLFYGKKNQLDHCSFLGKTNMGVLLAVILDDDRSRENYHSINHNYFGERVPLGSNGGEIIRVGVSQHCQFNSNTQIINNFFEYCDGETEIVSIKSGSNVIKDNVFKESQGSVVLRHGDNNIVSNNFFYGNDKKATGGVRVINKGQQVMNNLFYKCRGADFRSPLAIMNGIPNSPAHRYVQVTDATIKDNIFYECAAITLCEGSDTERTLPPARVVFERNSFYNSRDSIIYKVYDDISGISFTNNPVSKNLPQSLVKGFDKTIKAPFKQPAAITTAIGQMSKAYASAGANWFNAKKKKTTQAPAVVSCNTAEDIQKQLAKKTPLVIVLAKPGYTLSAPLIVESAVQFTSKQKKPILFETGSQQAVFVIGGNGHLTLNNITMDGSKTAAQYFISNDASGLSDHYNLSIKNSTIQNFSKEKGCTDLFFAYKSFFADSIIVRNNQFSNNNCNGFTMNSETDNKGYYGAEKIIIGHNKFNNQQGTLVNLYRGGNDESTLGPDFTFSHNKLENCNSNTGEPVILLTGVQVSNIISNSFVRSNSGNTLVKYKDFVRAKHLLSNNTLTQSGSIEENKYVTEKENQIK